MGRVIVVCNGKLCANAIVDVLTVANRIFRGSYLILNGSDQIALDRTSYWWLFGRICGLRSPSAPDEATGKGRD
jgi:hypothetical protein